MTKGKVRIEKSYTASVGVVEDLRRVNVHTEVFDTYHEYGILRRINVAFAYNKKDYRVSLNPFAFKPVGQGLYTYCIYENEERIQILIQVNDEKDYVEGSLQVKVHKYGSDNPITLTDVEVETSSKPLSLYVVNFSTPDYPNANYRVLADSDAEAVEITLNKFSPGFDSLTVGEVQANNDVRLVFKKK